MTFLAHQDLSILQDRVNRILRESFTPESPGEVLTKSNFAPPVDVYENEQSITLKIEVPGIEEKDINVSIENNTLTVRGERRFEKDEKEENFQRVERMYGTFTRSFTLTDTVDQEQVTAHYDKGVLKICLVKKAEAKPRLIQVNVEKTVEAQSASKVA
jgi:HSP20 family protein